MHVSGKPLVLYNVWDAGGAKALEDTGSVAIATGSLSMAAAHGYADGQFMPSDLVLPIAGRLVASVSCPVDAGADGSFVPDLSDHALIAEICDRATIPVNVMMSDTLGSVAQVAALGVARASYGPFPFFRAMEAFAQAYRDALVS